MLVIILVIMTGTIFFTGDAFTHLKPSGGGAQVALIGDDAVGLGGHTRCAAGRETADEDIVINIATYNLSVGIVALATI